MNNELCNKYNLFILKTSIYVIWKWKFITEEGRTHVTIGVSGGEHTQSRYLQGIHGGGGISMFILSLTQLSAQLLPPILNKVLSQWQSLENKHRVSVRNTVSDILQTINCFFSYIVIVYYIWYHIKHLMTFSYYHMSPHNISGLQWLVLLMQNEVHTKISGKLNGLYSLS